MNVRLLTGLLLSGLGLSAYAGKPMRIEVLSPERIIAISSTYPYTAEKVTSDTQLLTLLEVLDEPLEIRITYGNEGEKEKSHTFLLSRVEEDVTATIRLPGLERNGRPLISYSNEETGSSGRGARSSLKPIEEPDLQLKESLTKHFENIARGLPPPKARFVRAVGAMAGESNDKVPGRYREIIALREYEHAFIQFSIEPLFRLGTSQFVREDVYPAYSDRLTRLGRRFSISCLADFVPTHSLVWLSTQIIAASLREISSYNASSSAFNEVLEKAEGFEPKDGVAKAREVVDALAKLDADLGDLLQVTAIEGLLQVLLQQRAFLEKSFEGEEISHPVEVTWAD